MLDKISQVSAKEHCDSESAQKKGEKKRKNQYSLKEKHCLFFQGRAGQADKENKAVHKKAEFPLKARIQEALSA